MPFPLINIAAIVIGYLLGSFPAAYIMARARKGIDIRDVDVHNMGAGAVIRVVGFWEGAVVGIADMGKGIAAILIAQALGVSAIWVLLAGFAAILGHCFPLYLGFRGGQGVATTIGIFMILAPVAICVTLVILGIAFLIARHLFSAIVITSPFLPLFIWILGGSILLIFYSLACIAFIIFRSRKRLCEIKIIRDRYFRKKG
jgi:glycerol-3-phosphate acyltransferase PlsY